MKRTFLGWNQPCLHSVRDILVNRYRSEHRIDMRDAVVVFSGARAGRRFLELLVFAAEALKLPLLPPEILTTGSLPEFLCGKKETNFANSLELQILFADALKAISSENQALLLSQDGNKRSESSFLRYADYFLKLYTEIASSGEPIHQLIQRIDSEHLVPDISRWNAFGELLDCFYQQLDAAGLQEKHRERIALIGKKKFLLDSKLFLVGVVDLPPVTGQLLSQVESFREAFIFAPEDYAEGFDQNGCVLPEYWGPKEIPVSEQMITVVEDSKASGKEIVKFLSSLEGKYTVEDISIGTTSSDFIPALLSSLREANIPGRDPAGTPLQASSLYQCFLLLGRWVQSKTFDDFLAFIRHPDILEYLKSYSMDIFEEKISPDKILKRFDAFRRDAFPQYITELPDQDNERKNIVQSLIVHFQSCFLENYKEKQLIADWVEWISHALQKIYGSRELLRGRPADRMLIEGFDQIRTLFQIIGSSKSVINREIDFSLFQELFGSVIREGNISAEAEGEAVEITGWLELALHDAPVACVVGMNEEWIPESLNADPFLPDQLRIHLGLQNNTKRHARDAYLLRALIETRDQLKCIAFQKDERGEGLLLSRLLLAIPDQEFTRRIEGFYSGSAVSLYKEESENSTQSLLVPAPPPGNLPPVKSVSVTAFRTYLQCPYQFYLRHVLRLSEEVHDPEELDPLQFGSLIHEVLKDFGNSAVKNSERSEEIFEFLKTSLYGQSRALFGNRPPVTVQIQLGQIEHRLQSFAKWQADWKKTGWEILHTEYALAEPVPVSGSENPIDVIGRIDRIDYHSDSGEYLILDYKTGEQVLTPERSHLLKNNWQDLQLPVYRLLFCQRENINKEIKTGFVLLPANTTNVGVSIAKWSENDFQEAEVVMHSILQKIHQQIFWPPSEKRFSGRTAMARGEGQYKDLL